MRHRNPVRRSARTERQDTHLKASGNGVCHTKNTVWCAYQL